MKRARFLYRSEGTLDTWCYAGTLDEAREAIADFLAMDLPEIATDEPVTIEIKRLDMTDDEVAALPDGP